MKKILNFLFLSFVFLTVFVAVFPKDKLYFFAQEKLKAYSITLESQKVESNAFNLEVTNTNVLLAGSKVASIKHLSISMLGANFSSVRPLGHFKNMIPQADSVDVALGLGEVGVAKGSFGSVAALLDLSKKKIILKADVKPAVKNKFSMIFKKFKKQGDGYVYELPF